MNVPAFVTFEGPEGSGKSTQLALLADALRRDGRAVVITREPGGTALGEALRALLLDASEPPTAEAEAYLMTAARAEHVRQVIRPALASGALVLCDRFADSTLAYQGAGRGLPLDQLLVLQELAVGDTWPTLTLLLDVPVATGLERRRRAGRANRLDVEHVAFHERVAAWYRSAAARQPWRWRVIDGTQDPAMVHTAVLNAVVATLVPGTVTSQSGSV